MSIPTSSQPAPAVPPGKPQTRKDLQGERLYTASQWRLMWWRFQQHKLAVASVVILLLAYLIALFCEFVAPHDPNRDRKSVV